MRIRTESVKCKDLHFDSLGQGSPFKWVDGVFMKTYNNYGYNSVCLKTGICYIFSPEEKVTPINGEFVIEEETK